jgi:hypothetical protein
LCRHRSLSLLAIAWTRCGLMPGGGGTESLIATSDLPVPATPDYPLVGTIDTGAFMMQTTIAGTVVDPCGSAMAGVVICYGPNDQDAVAKGVTDSGGAYSAAPPQSFSRTAGNLM